MDYIVTKLMKFALDPQHENEVTVSKIAAELCDGEYEFLDFIAWIISAAEQKGLTQFVNLAEMYGQLNLGPDPSQPYLFMPQDFTLLQQELSNALVATGLQPYDGPSHDEWVE